MAAFQRKQEREARAWIMQQIRWVPRPCSFANEATGRKTYSVIFLFCPQVGDRMREQPPASALQQVPPSTPCVTCSRPNVPHWRLQLRSPARQG